jgi:hypothetical protein
MKSYKQFLNEIYNLTHIKPPESTKITTSSSKPRSKSGSDPYGDDPAVIAKKIKERNRARKKSANQ